MDRPLVAAYAAFLIALAAHAQGDSLEALPRPGAGSLEPRPAPPMPTCF